MGLRLGIGKFYNLQGDRPLETGQEMLGPRGGGGARVHCGTASSASPRGSQGGYPPLSTTGP